MQAHTEDVNPSVRYIAEPNHVREVSLLGTADWEFWKERLKKEELVPIEHNGKARILVTAAAMKFMGVRFTEVSFSIFLRDRRVEVRHHALFLAQAFNSCRPFAFCERMIFGTPYLHGKCRLSTLCPVSIELATARQVAFRAKMIQDSCGDARRPSRVGEEGWEGTVFLPGRRGKARFFFARVGGFTSAYPFLPNDRLTITPLPDAGTLRALLDSQFTPEEWLVREDATHGKSKTYKSSEPGL